MNLIKLIYTSTASDACDSNAIDEILETSRRLNDDNSITGILYFSNNYFMQYLEGNKPDVEETYKRIAQDNRHHNVRLIEFCEISHRNFENWAMAYIPQSDVLTPIHLKFMNTPEFNPKRISTDNVQEVIMALHANLPKAYYNEPPT